MAGKYVETVVIALSGMGPRGSQLPGCRAFDPTHMVEESRQDGLQQEATWVPTGTRGYDILFQTDRVSVWIQVLP